MIKPPELNLLIHPGLGRCGSSTIQFYLSNEFGEKNSFVGDTKIKKGLCCENLKEWNSLFPYKKSKQYYEEFNPDKLAKKIIDYTKIKKRLISNEQIYIILSEERITDSLNYDIARNVNNLNLLINAIKVYIDININVYVNLVIRSEKDLIRSFFQNNSYCFKSCDQFKNFILDIKNGNDDSFFNFPYVKNELEKIINLKEINIFNLYDLKLNKRKFINQFVSIGDLSFDVDTSVKMSEKVINSNNKKDFLSYLKRKVKKYIFKFLHIEFKSLYLERNEITDLIDNVSKELAIKNTKIWDSLKNI